MEHIAALLLIVGCSHDMKQCDELPAPAPIYETYGECGTELQAALRRFEHVRPHVMAKCIYVDPAMEEEDAELVWDIKPDGTLEATVEPAQVNVAALSRQHLKNN